MKKKREMPSIVRGVFSNKDGVSLQVVDGERGELFQLTLSWKEMEQLCRKIGTKRPIGDLPRKVSNTIREMMETEPE